MNKMNKTKIEITKVTKKVKENFKVFVYARRPKFKIIFKSFCGFLKSFCFKRIKIRIKEVFLKAIFEIVILYLYK